MPSGQLSLNFDKEYKQPWTPEKVRVLLETDEGWRKKAFFSLWKLTTFDVKDKRGFNKIDYKEAKDIWRSHRAFGEFTPCDLYWLKKRIPKYAKQLYEVKRGLR